MDHIYRVIHGNCKKLKIITQQKHYILGLCISKSKFYDHVKPEKANHMENITK